MNPCLLMYLLLTLPLCITISAFSQSLWRVCARFTKILHLFWASNSSNRNVRMLVWYAGMKRFKKAITMFHHLWNDDHVKKQSQHGCWSPRVGEAWAGVGETSQNAEHSISHRSEFNGSFAALAPWPFPRAPVLVTHQCSQIETEPDWWWMRF